MVNRWADAAKAVRPLLFSVALVLFVAGCKSTDDFVGSGPLTVSPRITDYYREQYLKSPGPHYFVVSRDSRWAGYTACSNGLVGCSGEGVIFSVLNRCEERAGEPCYVLDKWGSVVWEGPVTFADGTTAGILAPEPATAHSALSDADVCWQALNYIRGQPEWAGTSRASMIREARARGFNPQTCDREVRR